MSKFRIRFSGPYTFRSRLLAALLLGSIIACLMSMAGSFLISIGSVSEEFSHAQRETALYLRELNGKTTMPQSDVMDLLSRENLIIRNAKDYQRSLNAQQRAALLQGEIVTIRDGFTAMPTTYLVMGDDVISIATIRDYNLFVNIFPRIGFAVLLSLVLFALLSVIASIRMAKPVSLLTQATRQIKEGDYHVSLPENHRSEMGELMQSFNTMADTLARTAYLQKDFISSISHEFRTPIASIRGFARLLQMPGIDEKSQQEYIDLIAQESDRLSRLSDTLLRLSALEQQTAPAALTTFRLDEQIRRIILQLQPAWMEKDIDWSLELEEVSIECDEELLMQVWINLIQNAVKFSHQGGTIHISVKGKNHAEIEITDYGVGMSEECLKRLFERFYQEDRSRHKEGVGLGLCLVKRIMDILGGTISAQSRLGEGSTFLCTLPLRPAYGKEAHPCRKT